MSNTFISGHTVLYREKKSKLLDNGTISLTC